MQKNSNFQNHKIVKSLPKFINPSIYTSKSKPINTSKKSFSIKIIQTFSQIKKNSHVICNKNEYLILNVHVQNSFHHMKGKFSYFYHHLKPHNFNAILRTCEFSVSPHLDIFLMMVYNTHWHLWLIYEAVISKSANALIYLQWWFLRVWILK